MQSKRNILIIAGVFLIALGLLLWAIRLQIDVYSLIPLVVGSASTLAWVGMNINFLTAKLTGRKAVEGANMAVSVIVFLVIVVFLYLLLDRHNARFDFTQAQKFTLASQTVKVLQGLNDDIDLQYLINPSGPPAEQANAKNLLELYKYHSGKIHYEFLDPEREPQKVQELAPVTLGAVYVRKGEKHEKVSPITEENLTNAIMKVTRGASRVVYFTTGHDEPSIEDRDTRDGLGGMNDMLKDDGFEVKELKLFENEDVPDDAAVVVVAGPKRPFFDTETAALKRYLDKGGDAIFLIDPETHSALEPFLQNDYGVKLGDDYVLENNPLMQALGGSPLAPFMNSLGDHPITKAFGEQGAQAISFMKVRSVMKADRIPDGEDVTELIKTSPQSWAETDLADLKNTGRAGLDEGQDIKGPISIAVAVSKDIENASPEADDAEIEDATGDENVTVKKETPQMRMVVFGDSDFISNRTYLQGMDLFLNSVNWLVKQEDLISIRPKDDAGQPLMLKPLEANIIWWCSLVVLPLIVAVFGCVVLVFKRMRG